MEELKINTRFLCHCALIGMGFLCPDEIVCAEGISEDQLFNKNQFISSDNSLAPPEELKVRSKFQSYDSKNGIFVAKGSASAFLRGYLISADLIRFSNNFNRVYAEGKVRIKKGNHYFQASSFRYDLIQEEGHVHNVYGVIDIREISDRKFLNKNSIENNNNFQFSEKVLPNYFPIYRDNKKKIDQNIDNLNLRNSLSLNAFWGGSRTDSSGIKLIEKIDRFRPGRFLKGEIKRWRVQADKLLLKKSGWEADRINFSNDPLSPVQSRLEAFDVIAKEDSKGDFIIIGKRSRLIFDEKLTLPFIRKKRITDEEIINRWVVGIDEKDRDGLYVGYNIDEITLGDKYKLFLQPQFLIQRSFIGGTNSYVSSDQPIYYSKTFTSIKNSDLFGLKTSLKGNDFGWNIDLNADISSLNLDRISHANRYWLDFNRKISLYKLSNINANLFGAYRYRAWNGSLGETEIYSAYGGFLEKKGVKDFADYKVGYVFRVGLGKYKADSFSSDSMKDLWRGNIYGLLNTNYPVWIPTKKDKNISLSEKYRYSPVPINSGLYLNATIDTSYSVYENGKNLNTLGLKLGPSLTLGKFRRRFFDYTNIKLSAGAKFKKGGSPFEFDEAVDLETLGIGLTQQIIGPLILSSELEFNIDKSSEFYGKLINSKLEARLQRRSYDLGFYYNPYKGIGGITIRLHDFNFDGNGIPFAPNIDGNRSKLSGKKV